MLAQSITRYSPLSKTVRFNVLKIERGKEGSGKGIKLYT
jgi:hypothetical protein